MRTLLAITKALADENRLRIVLALQNRELCLCQLVELLSLAPSTVSRHMSILQQAQLVAARKEGRWTYFRLADRRAPAAARDAIRLVHRNLKHDRESRRDQARIDRILKLLPEDLCKKQT